MNKPRIGAWLIGIVAVASIVVPAAVDFNESHLFNPDWPPHAVLHDAMSFLMSMGLGGGALYLLAGRAERRPGDMALAAVLAVWSWVSLLLGALIPTASYGNPAEGLKIPEVAGVPAIALGNRCVVIPSEAMPLAATDLIQVIETSDVPAGVINIVTGARDALATTLAAHDQLGAMWYFGGADGGAMVERAAAATIKRTWVSHGRARDWASPVHGEGRAFLRHASQLKTIWLLYGD